MAVYLSETRCSLIQGLINRVQQHGYSPLVAVKNAHFIMHNGTEAEKRIFR
ncbi:hypothetical protein [Spirosoma luteum]|uniref:hypothetical protein n=1 Tax=Spirosoma luteum TaxID=431553 RepID=UPI000372BD86|nr:hypothetical protein [Spirosoma luteum]